jgi:hypothetical protein
MTPLRRTYKHDHVDQRSQTDWEGGQKQALMRMAQHFWDELGIECISKDCEDGEEQEKDEVRDEKDGRDHSEPVAVVGKLVQCNGHNTGAHGDDEPTRQQQQWVSHGCQALPDSLGEVSRRSKVPDDPPDAAIVWALVFILDMRNRLVCRSVGCCGCSRESAV